MTFAKAHMVVPPDRLPMDDDTSFWARMDTWAIR